jgi:WD40 repeat protein
VGRLGGPGSGEDPDLTPTVSVAAAPQDEKDCSVAQPPLALAAGSARTARRRHAIVTAAAVLLLGLVSAASWWFGGGGRGPALPVQQLGEGIPTDRSITLMPAGALAEINAGVPCIAIAPDSKSLYGGALDGSVCQWDIASVGKGAAVAPAAAPLVRRFEGTKGIIRAVAVHERWVAAGGQAKTVWLWPAGSAKPKVALDDFNGDIRALAISRDGRRLAVGSYTEARLYELDEGGARLIKVLGSSAEGQVKCYMVLSVAFSPDSRWLAATSWRDRCVAVWDAEGGQLREVVRGQPDDPTAVTFLGGDQVLIGLFKAGVRLWNIKTAEMRPLAASKGSELRSMAVGGRNAIVVGEWGGTIRIYDRASEAPAQVIRAATSKSTLAVALAPDGRLAATCGGAEDERGGYIHLWQVTERTE